MLSQSSPCIAANIERNSAFCLAKFRPTRICSVVSASAFSPPKLSATAHLTSSGFSSATLIAASAPPLQPISFTKKRRKASAFRHGECQLGKVQFIIQSHNLPGPFIPQVRRPLALSVRSTASQKIQCDHAILFCKHRKNRREEFAGYCIAVKQYKRFTASVFLIIYLFPLVCCCPFSKNGFAAAAF